MITKTVIIYNQDQAMHLAKRNTNFTTANDLFSLFVSPKSFFGGVARASGQKGKGFGERNFCPPAVVRRRAFPSALYAFFLGGAKRGRRALSSSACVVERVKTRRRDSREKKFGFRPAFGATSYVRRFLARRETRSTNWGENLRAFPRFGATLRKEFATLFWVQSLPFAKAKRGSRAKRYFFKDK